MIYKYLILIILMLAMSLFAYGYGIESSNADKKGEFFAIRTWAILFVITILVIIWG